jgi:hypothetical protein
MCEEIQYNNSGAASDTFSLIDVSDIYYQIYNTYIVNNIIINTNQFVNKRFKYYKNTSRIIRMKLYITLRGAYAVDAHVRRIRYAYRHR